MAENRYQLLKKKSQIVCLSQKVNGHRIFMFRDDPEDFGFGGNKVRFFEYLIPEIIDAKPQKLVTSGSMFSNHIRVTAQVAALLGIPCELFLTEDQLPETLYGNVALAKEAGAEFNCIGHFAALLKIEELMNQYKEEGINVFRVQNGGHTPGAVRAYAGVVREALDELDAKGVRPAKIFLPCASGTTHAGVLCGGADRALPPVVSFAVANKPVKAQRGISRLITAAEQYLPAGFTPDEISVLDCGKSDYGHPDEELLTLRAELLKTDGIELDPTYNINAFYGMLQALEEMPGEEDVLYINTGGYTRYHG